MSLNQQTLSSLSKAETNEGATVERRNAERQISVFLAAKLMANGCECPCRIQNLSPKGAKIETPLNLHITDSVTIEFRSDLIVQGTVRWRGNTIAGIEFDDLLNVKKLLKKTMPTIARVKPRPPRYQCDIPALIIKDGDNIFCRAIDVSTPGLKIRSPGRLRRGDIVTVKVEGLTPHKARVVWLQGEHCGLKLQNPYSYDEIRTRLFTVISTAELKRS